MPIVKNPLWLVSATMLLPAAVAYADAPPLMHAKSLQPDAIPELSAYLVSEKLDGVRGYWNGQEFQARSGLKLNLPARFTAQLPPVPLDGELWLGRGRFNETAALLRRNDPDDPLRNELTYQVFDLPAHQGDFYVRYQAMKTLLPAHSRFVHVVQQVQLSSVDDLNARLDQVIAEGGEGLMLHLKVGHYEAGRSDHLLKDKRASDAEARVIGYRPGHGKYEGEVGSLLVRLADGTTLGLGSGLSDYDRAHPPAIGTEVTYRYNGFTANGKPRFARFLRIHDKDF